jgi:hypothetical protein
MDRPNSRDKEKIMEFYIREWTDKSASLITRDGHRLWTFASVESALSACRDWYRVSEERVISDFDEQPGNQTLTCSTCSI